MNGALISLDDMERSQRWGPPEAEAPPPVPVPVYWHGEAGAEAFVPYLIKGLLPASGIALLAGQSGAGKTFLALDIAGSLGLAEPWFGRKIREAGGTLFLAAEAVGTIGERIDAMHKGREIDRDALPIAWREVSGLNDPQAMEALTAEAIAIGAAMRAKHDVPLSLIVVDTLAAAFAFENENDASEATKAMQALARLSDRTGALVLALAHFGKTADSGVRGSSALTASADAILSAMVDRDTGGKVQSRHVALTKSRRTETGWNCPFDLAPVDMGTDEDGEAIVCCYVAPALDAARLGAAPKARRLPAAVIAYRDALQIALNEYGKETWPFGREGSLTLTVDRERVRDEFYRRHPADGDTKQIADARRQAFHRAERAALGARIAHVLDINGTQHVWRLDPA